MTTAAETVALTVRDLGAGYPNSFQIRDVSFGVPPGAVVGLIGPNGGGKSTILKAISGILPLSAGSVLLGSRPIRELAARVAFVPQREDVNWAFPVSARDVVLMGRYRAVGWLRRPGRRDREAAEAALVQLGLEGLADRHISQFSGGQQQRIFLARAMVQAPLLVVLDEPFTGVDRANREIFHQAIREFAERGVPVLMATHDLEEMQATCSHVACINDGLVAFGPVETTYTPENLRATFGGRLAVFR